MNSALYLRRLLFLSFLWLGFGDTIKRTSGEEHLVTDSQDFFKAMHNKSRTLVYLENDVAVRNYYGWVLQSSRNPRPTKLEGSIEVSSNPRRYYLEGRPRVDLDGSPLHLLLTGRQKLVTKSVHYTNVHLPSDGELMAVQKSEIELEQCVVEVFVQDTGRRTSIRSKMKYIRSLMQDPAQFPSKEAGRVTDWWCERNEGIDCKDGAVLFYNVTIPWTENYSWRLVQTIIKFVPITAKEVGISDAFLKAIEGGCDRIAIPFSLELNFKVCKQMPIFRPTMIYDPQRSIPPLLVINFQERLYGCISVVEMPITIRVTDLILRNIFSSNEWPVVFPFIDAGAGAVVALENVIVEMDTDQLFSNSTLSKMVSQIEKRRRPLGLGEGSQLITVWKPEDCENHLMTSYSCHNHRKCPKEAKCPSGAIFIEDASFFIEEGDGNNDLGIGVQYHIRHSLITVIPPHGGHVNRTKGALVTEFTAGQEETRAVEIGRGTPTRQVLLVVVSVVTAVAVAVAAGVFFTYKFGSFKRLLPTSGESEMSNLPQAIVEKLGLEATRTMLTPEVVSGTITGHVIDSHQSYQQTASHLLGSVTLGPMLGAGSFGKVFKATWNGATVAVKVIVHDDLSYRYTNARREALLSSNLHHPNIVQTFVQTTRSISHDEHIPTIAQPHPPPARTSHDSPREESPVQPPADNGYCCLADMVPNDYRPEPPPPKSTRSLSDASSAGRSFTGDRTETWLVQEFCDMGSLEKAIRKGKFMNGNQLNMILVVDTCVDICRGMHYLKNRNIIHGDLKSSNILLNGSMHEEKGFVAKVADFGLSRELGMHASHIRTQTTGTVTHMPPELFKEERLTAASDVYSFGIVMWELVSKESPLEGVPHFLIIKKIVYDNWRPTFLGEIPEAYMALARRCWDEDSRHRPTMDEVLSELQEMRKEFLQTPSEPPSL